MKAGRRPEPDVGPGDPQRGLPTHSDGQNPSDYFLNQPRYSRSLAIGLAVAGCFRGGQALGVSGMADMLGLSKSTTHRYVTTLVAFGWLEQTQARKYRLGPRSAWPGMAVLGEIALLSQCEPVLCDLRAQTGYTASLGILDGTCVTYVRRFPGHRRGQFKADGELRAGAHVPIHCTALGKALLAGLPDEEFQSVLAGMTLVRHAPNTITAKRRLREQVQQVTCDGLAISDREFLDHERSVAAAVPPGLSDWRLGVELNVPAGSSSIDELLGSVGELVRDAATRIGRRQVASSVEAAAAPRNSPDFANPENIGSA